MLSNKILSDVKEYSYDITGTVFNITEPILDIHNYRNTAEKIENVLKIKQPKIFILNFKNVIQMDSMFIGFIINLNNNFRINKKNLFLMNPSEHIQNIIKLSKLANFFTYIHDDLFAIPEGQETVEYKTTIVTAISN